MAGTGYVSLSTALSAARQGRRAGLGDDIKQAVLSQQHVRVAMTAFSWSVRAAHLGSRGTCAVRWGKIWDSLTDRHSTDAEPAVLLRCM